MPMVIPMLTKTWNIKIAATPTAISCPNLSLAEPAIMRSRQITIA